MECKYTLKTAERDLDLQEILAISADEFELANEIEQLFTTNYHISEYAIKDQFRELYKVMEKLKNERFKEIMK